jgi:hypothetical protein
LRAAVAMEAERNCVRHKKKGKGNCSIMSFEERTATMALRYHPRTMSPKGEKVAERACDIRTEKNDPPPPGKAS